MPVSDYGRSLVVLLLLSGAAMLVSVSVGSSQLGLAEVIQVALGRGSELERTLVLDLRLPRVLSAFATGGLLAVVAAGWGAVITLMLALAPARQLPGMLYWLMGDLAYARAPWPGLVLMLVTCLVAVPLGRSLNVLARGPLQAAALGVSVRPLEWLIYIAASLLTATAVTTAGAIGFVGLVVPHMLRLVLGNDQRLILPACALAGGTLLVLADTLARVVIAPEQLPVGVITALLGVPTFLYLLHRSR